MKAKFLLFFLSLPAVGAYAQETVLTNGTQVEVRVVSVLDKKGKKEKILAFVQSPVRAGNGEVLIKENTPVKVSVKKKDARKPTGVVKVEFTSVESVTGRKVNLTGTLFKSSRILGKNERREKNATNLALVAFGYFPTETLPKKVDMPEVTITGEVFVLGDYEF